MYCEGCKIPLCADKLSSLGCLACVRACSVGSSSSAAALEAEDALRSLTLELCNASGRDYEVVLTSGATGALRLVRVQSLAVSEGARAYVTGVMGKRREESGQLCMHSCMQMAVVIWGGAWA